LERLELRADFEGGNAEGVEVVGPAHVRFRARRDESPRPLWFYFQLTGPEGLEVRVDLANASECLGGTAEAWRVARPVFSHDGRAWRRVRRTRYHEALGTFSFYISLGRGVAWAALCYPYTYSDLLKLLERLSRHPHARVEVIGESAEGRPIYAITVTDPSVPSREKVGVAATARHHAGETPGSFTLEGLLEFLLRDEARPIRRRLTLRAYPMVDVDGVVRGLYGKDRGGRLSDFNRDWTDSPRRPEVRAVRDDLDEWAGECNYRAFLDFHAPTLKDFNYFYLISRDEAGEGYCEAAARVLRLVALRCPDLFRAEDYREVSTRDPNWRYWHRSSCYYQHSRYGVLSLACETSYNLSWQGEYMTEESMRRLGRSIGWALSRYLLGEWQGL